MVLDLKICHASVEDSSSGRSPAGACGEKGNVVFLLEEDSSSFLVETDCACVEEGKVDEETSSGKVDEAGTFSLEEILTGPSTNSLTEKAEVTFSFLGTC